MYHPAPTPAPSTASTQSQAQSLPPQQSTHRGKSLPTAKNATSSKKANSTTKSSAAVSSFTPAGPAIRRESSRQIKLPSRLEDDDPQSMKARLMKNCAAVLKTVREKDALGGSFFAEPVDPVAHGIPTYHQIITNPMDLGTIQAKMDANEIQSPEEFARLTRLVFENAIKFNDHPTHVVHQAARNLLTIFNNRFRDVERLLEKKKPTKKELKEKKKKEQEEQKRREKRKREEEADPRLGLLRQMQMSSQELQKSLESFRLAMPVGTNNGTSVTRNEFSLMSNVIYGMQAQMTQMQALLTILVTPQAEGSSTATAVTATSATGIGRTPTAVSQDTLSSLPQPVSESNTKKPKRAKKPKVEKPAPAPVVPKPAPTPVPAPRKAKEEIPLTLEEQQELTEAINTMSQEKLEGVIEIIRESADLNEDEEEIDLEIDQLKISTQRKLMNFVLKSKPKTKGGKKGGSKKNTPVPSPTPAPTPAPAKTQTSDNLFAAYPKADESDSEASEAMEEETNKAGEGNVFQINPNTAMDEDDDDDDDDDGGTFAANWNIKKDAVDNEDDSGDEDDEWQRARGASAAQKALDKERQAREQKMIADAEEAKEKSRAEAAERGKKLQEERKAKEAEAARLREQKEKEEKERAQKAREEALQNLKCIRPTVNLEAQRDIMKEYEQSFYDKDLAGGASPSSDFGF